MCMLRWRARHRQGPAPIKKCHPTFYCGYEWNRRRSETGRVAGTQEQMDLSLLQVRYQVTRFRAYVLYI